MQEAICEYLKSVKNRAVTSEEICEKVFNKDTSRIDEINQALNELQKDRKVYCTNSTKALYMISPFKVGRVNINKYNHGFVSVLGEEDLYIDDKDLNDALDGDTVLVKIIQKEQEEGKKKEAKIKEIIERKAQTGEMITEDHKRYVMVGNNKISVEASNNLVDGMIVKIEVSKNKIDGLFQGNIIKTIGHKNAPLTDIKQVMAEYDFDTDFSKEALEELKNIPDSVTEEEIKNEMKIGRRDFRDKEIFTIDGDDTKDIDDAISLEINEKGNYVLGIHIADVTHYVKENSALDKDAREKGTSAYLADRVAPMFPPALSNGICSLNEDVDRMAVSTLIELQINEKTELPKIISVDICESVIHSRKKMTYKEVNKVLDNNPSDAYLPFVDTLFKMKKISDSLRKMKVNRGYLEFYTQEAKIILNEKGEPIQILKRNSGVGEELIEDFMIACNEAVAEYINTMELNFMYRVHDKPNFERLQQVVKILKTYDGSIAEDLNIYNAASIQKILNKINKEKNEKAEIINNIILRCMAKAKYDTYNIGHYGIGSQIYCHFTSPIRRYPDDCDHRIVKDVLHGNLAKYATDTNLEMLSYFAQHSSTKERDSEACEKEVDKMKMAEYMIPFIGQQYRGYISGFTNNAMFVMLKNLVEGRLSYESMDDFYTYEKDFEQIVGKRNKKIYRLGDEIDVTLVKASKELREIDFEMVRKRTFRGKKQDGNTK